ncbi:MAG: hypothetical protein ACLQVL_08500 [Terriglobia bacterium]
MKTRSNLLVRATVIVVLLQLLPATAAAGDQEFHLLVDRVSSYYQKRPMPFMGLLSFIGNRFTPHGVSHLQMAVFEDVDSSRMPTGNELESFLQGTVGRSYQPFVRVHNNHNGEQTYIYARECGKQNYEMLIVSMERTEAVVIKIQLNPDAMRNWVDEPVNSGRDSAHGGANGVARHAQEELPAN